MGKHIQFQVILYRLQEEWEPITGRLNADSGVQFISSIIGEENGKYLIMNTLQAMDISLNLRI